MAIYRPRAVLVHAEPWEPGAAVEGVTERREAEVVIGEIATPFGRVTLGAGDLVVTGPSGERYPMKAPAFAAMFEPVGE